MAVRTQTAQEISMTRAGARSRRLRDSVALPPVPETRVARAADRGEPRSASWPVVVEPVADAGDGPRILHPV